MRNLLLGDYRPAHTLLHRLPASVKLVSLAAVPVLVVQQVLPPLLVAGLVERCETGWRLTSLGAGTPAARRRA